MRVGVAGISLALGVGVCYSAVSIGAEVCIANTGGGFFPYVPANSLVSFAPTLTTVTVPLTQTASSVIFTVQGTPVHDPTPGFTGDGRGASPYVPYVNCPAGSMEQFQMSMNEVAGMSGTYHTNVSNIGYRTYYPARASPGPLTNTAPSNGGLGNALYFPGGTPKIEFVLLDNDWSGTREVEFADYFAFTLLNGNIADKDHLLRYRLTAKIAFVPAPCQFVTSQAMTVALDSVLADDLITVGTAVNTKGFFMRMQCAPTATPPLITFQGTPDGSGLSGVIANDPNLPTGAQNVSILLESLDFGAVAHPVDLSGTSTIDTLTNLGSCGANCREWRLDLQASYVRTNSNPVVEGNIVARAEVTVEYP